MTELTELQEKTVAILQFTNSLEPVTGRDIANRIGLRPRSSGKEGADMRSIIHALRIKGFPICANGDGYFWARTSVELNDFIRSFQARVDDQQRAIDGMKESHSKVPIKEQTVDRF